MGLLQLAPEILIEIFLYLGVSDIRAFRSTNHFLNSVYSASTVLQYTVECHVAHVLDNPNCHHLMGDRLRMLRDREAAWRSLEPTSKRTISPVEWLESHHTLVTIERDHYLFSDSFTISYLPIREFHEKPFQSLFQTKNLEHICCSIDEHDLVACLACPDISAKQLEVQIQLIQYSTGTSHPLAANPTIIVSPAEWVYTASRAMQVFGENLVFTVHIDGGGWLYIYDWMTGIAKCERSSISECASITVLNEDLILIPDSAGLSLGIYHIPPSSTGADVKLICQLGLPALHGSVLQSIECQSAPNPTGNGEFPKHLPSSVPFIDDPRAVLILVISDLGRLGSDCGSSSISFVVHRSSIIDALPPSNHWSTLTTPKVVHWKTWGSSVTHWSSIPHTEYHPFYHYIYGQRLILPIPSNEAIHAGEGTRIAIVKDFNKNHVRHAQTEKEDEDFKHKMLKRKAVKNNLPFYENYLVSQHKSSGYSITDSLIIGFNKSEQLANDWRSTERSLEIMFLRR